MQKEIICNVLLILIGVFQIQSSVFAAPQEATDSGSRDEGFLDDRLFSPLDVFQLESVTDARISRDGSKIAYVRRSFDIMSDRSRSAIWLVEPGVGPNVDPGATDLPLLTGSANYSSPRWSPDGYRLAYVSNEDGSTQIHCYWLEAERSAAITRLTESPGAVKWSPDGKWLSFTMRVPRKKKPFASLPTKPEGAQWAESPEMITRLRYRSDGAGFLPEGYQQLFIVSSTGGTPRQITSGEFDHGGSYCWHPESNALIFSANRNEDHELNPGNSEIYSVSLATREIVQLTDRNGPDSDPFIGYDGTKICYTGYDDQLLGNQNSNLYAMNLDGSGSELLIDDLDRSIGNPRWFGSSDRAGILYQYDDLGSTVLGWLGKDGAEARGLDPSMGGVSYGRPYGSGMFSVSDQGTVAFTRGAPDRPSDLAILDLTTTDRTELRQITFLNEDLLGHKELGRVEEIWFKSAHGGLDLQGWIVYPPDFDPEKKYPMILEIHGGPFANYGPRFSAEFQLFAAEGYVVFYMNPRGSTSYGAAFANEIHHDYPGNDYDDLMSGVDEMLKRGFVDENNLFITGGSGGGVLTAWSIGMTDRFQAAVVAKPVINWYSFALTADMYNYFYKYWFPGYPWDHPEEYMRRSPISLVGNVNTPTMLLTGTEDWRTPMSETEQYYQALKLRQIDTAMVRVPGAGHGIAARPSHLIAKVAYILQWFETHKHKEPNDEASGAEE
ncbi:MAG: S9 family peptidase [Planctomycetota bacterium]